MTQPRRKRTRADKVEEGTPKIVKQKFQHEREESIKAKPLVAKTQAQIKYIEQLKTCKISVASGHSGCGKSFVASYLAAQMLEKGQIEKIYITRPYAHLGNDYGATPGSDFEKLFAFCRPMLDTIKNVVGTAKYNYYIEKGIVEIAPMEKVQGRSFDDPCVILSDEIQNATKAQVLSLITRIGEGVKFLAIMGDPRQSISKGENALDWVVSFFERHNIDGVGITHFTEKDCVRSGIVRDILLAFEREGGFYNKL